LLSSKATTDFYYVMPLCIVFSSVI